MSDYWKKFKSIFIVEDEEPKVARKAAKPKPQRPSPAQPVDDRPAEARPGGIRDQFVKILMNALKKHNRDGFDYLEFRESLQKLSSLDMDEPTRFRSSFAMAQTLGITKEQLIESGQFYQGILEKEKDKFGAAHKQQKSRLVDALMEEMDKINAGIQQKESKIAQLQSEIEEAKQMMQRIKGEMNTNNQKIEQTRADFDATFKSVHSNISENLKKIEEYL